MLKLVVSGEDYRACRKASGNMWANTKKGAYGKGLNNTNSDPHRVERLGRLGEMAMARHLGVEPNLDYKKYGDDRDFTYKGLKVDVKTAFRDYGAGLVYAVNE